MGLCDHIAFAAENIQNKIIVRNKLLKEIQVLYNEEFSIAQWAVEYLTRTLNIPYSYDEAGYIAVHINSARSYRSDNSKSIREVAIVSKIIGLIEKELEIDIHSEDMSLSYSRLVHHLRLLIHRFQKQHFFRSMMRLSQWFVKNTRKAIRLQKNSSIADERFLLSGTDGRIRLLGYTY
ncbi:PRD domain-containing protein [Lachnospiraceae bacterium ZAX-1]